MSSQVSAILWAQWRGLRNSRRQAGPRGSALPVVLAFVWYGLWTVGAFAAGAFSADRDNQDLLQILLPSGLMLGTIYWQLAPILASSMGASLDLRKLLVYPVPQSRFFLLEVLLRLTGGLEVLLILAGVAVGLFFNPTGPTFGITAFLPFVCFNLLLSAGLRHLLERILNRRHVREVAIFLLVLAAGLPQLLIRTGVPPFLRDLVLSAPHGYFPWSTTALLAQSQGGTSEWIVLLAWTMGAYLFGRWQFERDLKFDSGAVTATASRHNKLHAWIERLYRLPRLFLQDPLAGIVEKELRCLTRSPRFRLVFLMGFTFGLLIFLPVKLGGGFAGLREIPEEYLALVSGYALLLLGDVVFWNVFGLDRSAAQTYFLVPVSPARIFGGKNLAAVIFVFLEVTAVITMWRLLGMPAPLARIAEVYAATLTFSLYLGAAGNLSSVYFPRPVDPQKATGTASSGRFRLLLILITPLAATPVALAYGARHLLQSQLAFQLILVMAALLGVAVYRLATRSAVKAVEQQKERFLQKLVQGEGPISFA